MTIDFAVVSIGIFLIVWGALIWKKLRVVEGRLTLMQDELALMHKESNICKLWNRAFLMCSC